jgi:hypothetical protein
MAIEIEWKTLLPDSKQWNHTHVLYAYVHPDTGDILYVGMAWHRTVGQRFTDRDKQALFDFFSNELGLSGVDVRVGEVWMDGRLTRQLLSDVESLLIRRLQPAGNIMCRSSRISRGGMRLKCLNEWPHERTRFVDR